MKSSGKCNATFYFFVHDSILRGGISLDECGRYITVRVCCVGVIWCGGNNGAGFILGSVYRVFCLNEKVLPDGIFDFFDRITGFTGLGFWAFGGWIVGGIRLPRRLWLLAMTGGNIFWPYGDSDLGVRDPRPVHSGMTVGMSFRPSAVELWVGLDCRVALRASRNDMLAGNL